MPFDGEVLKLAPRGKRGNGIYIKVRYRRSGLIAYFLHLSKLEKGINTGRRLKARDKIGEVGNTGRSFAPHLHYQIETAGKKVLDPYYIHGSTRGTISQSARKSFEETVLEYDQAMGVKQL